MDDGGSNKLSTSALAKQLDLSTQQLFASLKDYGWIRKVDDGWALTAKGEFEGGEYVHSKKYGRYIVWPPEIADHPLLKAMEDNRFLSATALGKGQQLSARETNRVLAELGWIRHSFQGWELTELGQQKGGMQLENDSSGTCYVVWPPAVTSDAVLARQLALTASIFNPVESTGDLFADADQQVCPDGHHHSRRLNMQVCHWLYLAGIAHSVHHRLPTEDALFADFYLPQQQLFIECWDSDGKGLAKRMQRRDIYQQLGFAVIDVELAEGQHVDDILTPAMRKRAIRVY